MKKFSMGLFGLALLLGNQLGSMLGVAVALCGWMIVDGLAEEFIRKSKKDVVK